MPLISANVWEGVLLGPCALAGLMLYDRAFRSVPIALLFTALYVVPSAGFASGTAVTDRNSG